MTDKQIAHTTEVTRRMSSWHSYPSIYNLGHRYVASILDHDVSVTEKVDGCLMDSTRITMADGSKQQIGSLYRSGGAISVLSFDAQSGRYSEGIVNTISKQPASPSEWITVITERKGQRGHPKKKITLTVNHPVLTPDGFKEAGRLTLKDRLLFETTTSTYATFQALLGSGLGDGNFSPYTHSNSRFTVSHSESQTALSELMARLLEPFGVRLDLRLSGYGSMMHRVHTRGNPELTGLYRMMYPNGTKTVSMEWLNRLDPIGIAIWYMDDGSLASSPAQRDRAQLATHGFSKEENELIATWMFDNWGWTASVKDDTKGHWSISLDTDSSARFFHVIAPFIIPEIRYKIPLYLRSVGCFWEGFRFEGKGERSTNGLSVVSVGTPEVHADMLRYKYDMEVENTHTFVANDFIVHNSQFSMGVIDGELKARSKGAMLHVDAPEKMFTAAVMTAVALRDVLHPGWTYRCEYLAKTKHNALAYSRIPNHHLIVFDVNTGEEDYLPYEQIKEEADRIGLETVPLIYQGRVRDIETFRGFLDRESILGGQKIEGVVIKPRNYNVFGADKKCIMAKFVSEAFKEVHGKEWKAANPGSSDVVALLASEYKTDARWLKAVQHLREAGQIEDSPRDIGKIIKEIPADILKECREEMMERLFKWAWPQISRQVTHGFPEWYKDQLLKRQFECPPPPKS